MNTKLNTFHGKLVQAKFVQIERKSFQTTDVILVLDGIDDLKVSLRLKVFPNTFATNFLNSWSLALYIRTLMALKDEK